MGEWEEMSLGKMLEEESISYGIVQPGSHTEINSVPILRVNNIKDGKIKTEDVLMVARSIENKYKRTRLRGGELLITVVGTVGECAIVPESLVGWNVARAVSVARIAKGYDTRFIKYSFKTDDIIFQMYGNTNDTVQPTLNLSLLKNLNFKVPPLPEQERIAEVLSSLDDKIDLLHRQNKTLEEMAETLFRQWFVEEAEESIEEISLSDISKHIKKSINPSKIPEQLFKHYSLPSFDNGRNPEIQFGREILSNKYQISPGQILISKLNPRTPRVWFINSCDNHSICSTEFQVYEPIKKEYTEFIYCLLKSNDTRDILTGASSGTSGSHQRVNPEDINKLTTKKPCEGRIKQFHQIASVWLYKIDKNSIQIQQLETLRDTLLPKLMSGQINVLKHELY